MFLNWHVYICTNIFNAWLSRKQVDSHKWYDKTCHVASGKHHCYICERVKKVTFSYENSFMGSPAPL